MLFSKDCVVSMLLFCFAMRTYEELHVFYLQNKKKQSAKDFEG